jgi:Glycosyl transferase family 2
MTPSVSVVMSVYNGERFLGEAVESVLTQTLSDLELIVVDDGSDDSGPQILAEYASRDPRVAVHRQANQGRAIALNRGIDLARAPFVARLDADDVAMPTRLEYQHQFLSEHAAVAIVGGAVAFVDESSRPFAEVQYPLEDAEIRRAFAHTTPLAHPAVMIAREALHSAGGFRPVLQEAEDVDLWLRIAERHELANLPDVVVHYRLHPAQATMRRLELQTLCSLAGRAAARARSEGKPDPLDTVERIDAPTLVALGVTREEITANLVRHATWLAKTSGRAGYADKEEELFAAAAMRARSPSGSRPLLVEVHRDRAARYREQGHRLRAGLERARGALAGFAR